MDFKTKAISRSEIRNLAKEIRRKFKCKNKYYFDVIRSFESLPILYKNVSTEIVLDNDPELGAAPSALVFDIDGNYIIKIKESIYEGAYFDKVGGYRNHIMHEICHYILFQLGYTPDIDKVYKNSELKCYESIEWQAKALAGEVLIPYEATVGLTESEIMRKCKVSKEAAQKRISLDK